MVSLSSTKRQYRLAVEILKLVRCWWSLRFEKYCKNFKFQTPLRSESHRRYLELQTCANLTISFVGQNLSQHPMLNFSRIFCEYVSLFFRYHGWWYQPPTSYRRSTIKFPAEVNYLLTINTANFTCTFILKIGTKHCMYLKMRAHKPTYLLSTVWTTKIEKKNDVKFDFYVIII